MRTPPAYIYATVTKPSCAPGNHGASVLCQNTPNSAYINFSLIWTILAGTSVVHISGIGCTLVPKYRVVHLVEDNLLLTLQ